MHFVPTFLRAQLPLRMEHKNMISKPLSSYLFLSYILILFSNATISTTFGFTNETDKQALLAIKDQIHEDPFKVLGSWNDSIHFCNWQGIICSRLHQRVTVLDLSSQKLVGSVSPHIGNLTFLKVIHLGNNFFHGTIPPQVGRLFRLQQFSLYINSFQGEFPTNLTRCFNIRVINMSENNFAGKIPSQLGSLSNLLILDLWKNHFSGKIPPSLGNLSALRKLSLRRNSLEGSIPSELGQLSNLEYLQLASNNLSGFVPTSLYNISSISYFVLTNNQLHGSLPPDLGLSLPKLQIFLFAVNNFSGPIPSSLANASGLVHFDITKNSFTGSVPMDLGNLGDLEKLNIGGNELGSNEANDLSFIDSLTNCSNLILLNFHRNVFGGVLPNSFANLSTKITSMSMQGNYIYGSIPESIGNLISLEDLGLNENMFTGNIPESIGKLANLKQLYIYTNNISGKIPSSIGNLSRFSILSFADNMLEGSIPVSLGNCKNLQALDLGSNHLTGTIPDQVLALSSISLGLFLRDNHLTGPLSPQVGNLKNTGHLDLSDNKLSGEIPSTLGSCLLLEFLSLKGNLFEGTIPLSFKQLRGLQVLDLSRNNLSGPIPSFLGELQLIENLNLSYNMFDGQVPDKGKFRNRSTFSVVGNNNLCGGIKALKLPACPVKAPAKERKLSAGRVIILVTSITLSILLLIACASAILYRKRRSKKKPSSDYTLGNQYPTLTYAELHQATDGFSSANLIGEGRYGSVYKGILDSEEQVVAVKVLNLQQHGANKSFLSECEALRNIRHRNLLKIITSCSSIDFKGNDFKALVFEFLPNGSLESWLHPISSDQLDPSSSMLLNSRNLNLIQRLNIAIDVASALDYLHHQCETAIIHCDLKPSNVLLDSELCGHVGDFGLAKFLIATNSKSNYTQSSSSIGVRGTVGYVAPEYGMGGEVSVEGDVYSYGILLLEMFTGKWPTSSMFADNFSLHNYAKMALPDGVMEMVTSLLILEEEEEEEEEEEDESERTNQCKIERTKECLMSVLRIGVVCSSECPRERMDIRNVLNELFKIRNSFLMSGGRGRREPERDERSK